MFLRILAYLHLVRLIMVVDFQGQVYYTVFRKHLRQPTEDIVGFCYVYPFTKIGYVTLYKDGSTGGKTLYIKTWLDVFTKEEE